MKCYLEKSLALLLAVGLLTSCLTGCGNLAQAETQAVTTESAETTTPDDSDQLTDTAESLIKTHGSETGKEETVYVIANADGTPKETIVSAWLKNPDGSQVLEDYSDLTDIENVKGEETFTQGTGDRLTWQADGSDIYYQGKSTKSLPVDTSISYELDGKTVSPEELDGASGHLVMTFRYDNHTAQQKLVNGTQVTLYQPFLVVSGTMLDGTKATNVTVTNGKVVNTGDQVIVVGMAMPGLRESLGLDDMKDADGQPLEIDIPETVTIEADVTNFSLMTCVTVMDNSMLSDLDLDNVETFDDLQQAVNDLTDASTQLVDGSTQLHDGVVELADGTAALSDGVTALDEGAKELLDGTESLHDGALLLQVGLDSYLAGETQLHAGIEQLADSTSGAPALAEGATQLRAGVDAALDGGNQLLTGYTEGGAVSGSAQLAEGAAQLNAAVQSASTITLSSDQLSTIRSSGASGAAAYSDRMASGVCTSISSGISAQKESITAAAGEQASNVDVSGSESAQQLIYLVAAGLAASDGMEETTANDYLSTAAAYVNGLASTVATSTATTVAQTVTDQIAASVGGEDTQSTVSSALWDSLAAIGSGVAEQTAQGVVSTVNSQLVQTYDSLGTATQALADGSAQLSTGVSQLYTGTDQLVQGLGTLSEGAAALEAGSQTLNSGIQALESGSTTLHSNNSALSSGLASATEGAKQLKTGASALKDGTAELVDGTGDLSDGVDALLDGAQELMDGMTEFDEEGIQTLANLFHDDAEPLMDRLRALQDYAGEYTSFSGANAQYPSTVRFILRTDSIGE